jgi:uroporphyrinogen-III decarboxylase
VYDICSNLAIFAKRNNNPGLHAKVFIPEYVIKKKKDGDLVIFASEVAALANQYKASLTDYAVVEADITKLTELIEQTKKEMPVPEAKYSDKKAARAELEKLFDETSDLLEEQLDRAVDSLRSKNDTFYQAYYFSRNIKNIGVRHESAPQPAAQ